MNEELKKMKEIVSKLEETLDELIGDDFPFCCYELSKAFRDLKESKKTSCLGFIIDDIENDVREEVMEEYSLL